MSASRGTALLAMLLMAIVAAACAQQPPSGPAVESALVTETIEREAEGSAADVPDPLAQAAAASDSIVATPVPSSTAGATGAPSPSETPMPPTEAPPRPTSTSNPYPGPTAGPSPSPTASLEHLLPPGATLDSLSPIAAWIGAAPWAEGLEAATFTYADGERSGLLFLDRGVGPDADRTELVWSTEDSLPEIAEPISVETVIWPKGADERIQVVVKAAGSSEAEAESHLLLFDPREPQAPGLRWVLPRPGGENLYMSELIEVDLTGDSLDELILLVDTWPERDMLESYREPVYRAAVYARDDGGRGRLVASGEPAPQLIDLDGDGVHELLAPRWKGRAAPEPLTDAQADGRLPPAPDAWQVSRWNGREWSEAERIGPAETPPLEALDPAALPPLPDSLYWRTDEALYRWPAAGGALERLTDLGAREVSFHTPVSPGSRAIAWRVYPDPEPDARRRDGKRFVLRRWIEGHVDEWSLPADGRPDWIGWYEDWEVSPDGRLLALHGEEDYELAQGRDERHWLGIFDLDSGERRFERWCDALDDDEYSSYGLPPCARGGFNDDGSRYVFISEEGLALADTTVGGGGSRVLRPFPEHNYAGGETKIFHAWDEPRFSEDGTRVIARDLGMDMVPTLVAFDPESGEKLGMLRSSESAGLHQQRDVEVISINNSMCGGNLPTELFLRPRLQQPHAHESPESERLVPRPEFLARNPRFSALAFAGDTVRAVLQSSPSDYVSHALVSIEADGRLSHLTRIPRSEVAALRSQETVTEVSFSRGGHVLHLGRNSWRNRGQPPSPHWVALGDGSRFWDASELMRGARDAWWENRR